MKDNNGLIKKPKRTFFNSLFKNDRHGQDNRVFILFLLPSLVSFLVFVITPFFTGLYYSLTDWNGLNTDYLEFVGFANYANIFDDVHFLFAFVQTFLYSFMSVIMINVVAFGLALIVTSKVLHKNVARAVFFMPNLIGGLVLGYIWQFVYNKAMIQFFDPSLIMSKGNPLLGLVIVVTWQYAGYIMMIYIAALQNVPQDLVEASKIDGASWTQRLQHIIFPLIAQAFTIAMFLTLVTSFKQYDTIVSLTQGGPAMIMPEWIADLVGKKMTIVNSLQLLTVDIIQEKAYSNYSLAQAKSIVFFFILLLFSLTQVYFNQKREVEL